jgi:hypothetical protein
LYIPKKTPKRLRGKDHIERYGAKHFAYHINKHSKWGKTMQNLRRIAFNVIESKRLRAIFA